MLAAKAASSRLRHLDVSLGVLNDDRYVDEMYALLLTFSQQPGRSARNHWELLELTVADVTRNFCLLEAMVQRGPRAALQRISRAAESISAERLHDCQLPFRALNDVQARLSALAG